MLAAVLPSSGAVLTRHGKFTESFGAAKVAPTPVRPVRWPSPGGWLDPVHDGPRASSRRPPAGKRPPLAADRPLLGDDLHPPGRRGGGRGRLAPPAAAGSAAASGARRQCRLALGRAAGPARSAARHPERR